MNKINASPLQYLAAYAITLAVGVIATNVWCLYGQYMRNLGRRELRAKHVESVIRSEN